MDKEDLIRRQGLFVLEAFSRAVKEHTDFLVSFYYQSLDEKKPQQESTAVLLPPAAFEPERSSTPLITSEPQSHAKYAPGHVTLWYISLGACIHNLMLKVDHCNG